MVEEVLDPTPEPLSTATSCLDSVSLFSEQRVHTAGSRGLAFVLSQPLPNLNLVASPPGHSAAAAAAKSLQSCPTLCDPMDCSPPGSSIPGILQVRTLEWGAISFSNV